MSSGIQKLLACSEPLKSGIDISTDAYLTLFTELSSFLSSLGAVCKQGWCGYAYIVILFFLRCLAS